MSFLIPRDRSQIQVPHQHHPFFQHAGSDHTINSGFYDRKASTATTTQTLRHYLEEQDSSVINFYPAWCHCFQCLVAKKYRRSDNVPFCTRFKNAFLCPPQGVLSRFLYFIFFQVLFWVICWGLDEEIATKIVSALIVLEILGLSFGILMKLINLPSLLAPLILGIVLNNIRFECHSFKFNFFGALYGRGWISPIRRIALTIILTRAGTELSPKQLRKMKGLVPAAAFGPCLVEAFTCAGMMYALFKDEGITVAMCFVAGFALAAVSPAVVVPGMLSLQKKGYGVKQGIPTLLVAASSIDDVLAISAYSIALSFTKETTEKGEEWKTYAGLVGIVVGLLHGLLVGIILHFIPSRDMGHNIPLLRLVLLLMFNLACMLTYEYEPLAWLSGAGSLGVLTTSFIASFGWRSVPFWKRGMHRIEVALAHIWTLFVPLLFGTIGNEIYFFDDFHWGSVAKLMAVIAVSLVIRLLTMFIISGFARINKKEQLFCALSWIPKATVQATLAPLVASEFKDAPDDDPNKEQATNVVLLAVLGILTTAPLGAVLISLTGKRLLRQSKDEPEEFPNGGDENDIDEVKEIIRQLDVPPNSSGDLEARKVSDAAFSDLSMPNTLGAPSKLSKLSGPSQNNDEIG